MACVREAALWAWPKARMWMPKESCRSFRDAGGMRSSMQKDVEQGKVQSWIAIAGPILRERRRHGIPVKTTENLVAAVETRAELAARRR